MAATTTYLERLVDNQYVQEKLNEGFDSLRAAYRRAGKRRVEPATDEKLRRQLRDAASSLGEAANALKEDRRRPRGQRTKRLVAVVVVVAGGAAAAWALSQRSSEGAEGLAGDGGGSPDPARASASAESAA